MTNKFKQIFNLPSAWRTGEVKQEKAYLPLKAESKISEWVDDINNVPLKIVIESQSDGSVVPWWDITMTYANGYTDKMKLKYKKRSGYIDYEPMSKVFKCILRNWRERKRADATQDDGNYTITSCD